MNLELLKRMTVMEALPFFNQVNAAAQDSGAVSPQPSLSTVVAAAAAPIKRKPGRPKKDGK